MAWGFYILFYISVEEHFLVEHILQNNLCRYVEYNWEKCLRADSFLKLGNSSENKRDSSLSDHYILLRENRWLMADKQAGLEFNQWVSQGSSNTELDEVLKT